MKTTSTRLPLLFVALVMVCMPVVSYAAYTIHGHTFATAAELATYVDEYNRVYGELHGTSQPSTTRTSTVTTTRTSTSAVKTASLEVTASKPADIDMYNVRLAGTVYFKTSKVVRVWFEYGPSPNALYYRSHEEVLDREGSSRKFDIRITELKHNTTYYYRAVGINEKGVMSYSAVKNTHTAVDPSVDEALVKASTKQATSIDADFARLQASISLLKAIYARAWFEYGDEEDDLHKKTTPIYITKANASSLSTLVTNLEDNTTYYYRVVALDPDGVKSYGKTLKFTTRRDVQDELPRVETYQVKDVHGFSATASALFDMNDYNNGVVFMVYGEDWYKVSQIAQTYRTYKSIKENGDALQKILIDSDLDSVLYHKETVLYLDPNTVHYIAFGIEYENAKDDDIIMMGKVQKIITRDSL